MTARLNSVDWHKWGEMVKFICTQLSTTAYCRAQNAIVNAEDAIVWYTISSKL